MPGDKGKRTDVLNTIDELIYEFGNTDNRVSRLYCELDNLDYDCCEVQCSIQILATDLKEMVVFGDKSGVE